MEKIESYEQCTMLIKNFKRSCSKVSTNFYFLPNELKNIIENRVIYYHLCNYVLIFYIEEEQYLRVYYFVMDGAIPAIQSVGKVQVLDLVARDRENSETARWKEAGFEEYKLYVRMNYELGKLGDKNKSMCNEIYDMACAKVSDKYNILSLWRESLDNFSTPLPVESEMEHLINSRHVYCIRKDNNIAAAVYMDVASKSCVLKHLAVQRAYRRQGLGNILMDYAMRRMALENIAKCSLWVDVDNLNACGCYKKYGFEEEGLWSQQMIWRDKNLYDCSYYGRIFNR